MNRNTLLIEAGIVLGLSVGCRAAQTQNQPLPRPVPEAATASNPLFPAPKPSPQTQIKPEASPVPMPVYRGDATSYQTEFKNRPCELNVTQPDAHSITLEGQMTTSELFKPSERFPVPKGFRPESFVSFQFARHTVCANEKLSGELTITEPLNDDTGSQFSKDDDGNTLIPLRDPASNDNKGAFNGNYDFLKNAVFPTGPVECTVMPIPNSNLVRIICRP